MLLQLSLPHLSTVLRRVALGATLLACGVAAQAGEAGRIVFVSGTVHSGSHVTAVGDAIQEGDELVTGKDGYIYMKTIDDGLLIVRPSSRARIAAYHVDRENPSNTRVKLELLSGVARSVSGTAVKQARQNFRFNTPVAAIGVRGTDFTVFTDQETSNVTVLSGAIVVSGFGGTCLPAGGGPCEHPASRELAAGQAGQMLQVRRGQAAPQLVTGSSVTPDSLASPRSDEPSGKSGGNASLSEPGLDAQKAALLLEQTKGLHQTDVASPPVPPTVAPADPVVVVPAGPQISWGRWTAVLNQPANIDTGALVAAGGKRVATNSFYTIVRGKGDWEVPLQGGVGFVLRDGEAFVMDSATRAQSPANMQNGQLNFDFGKKTFDTSFDLKTGSETFKLQSTGNVGSNGEFTGNSMLIRPNNMAVSGQLGPDSAAYIFNSRLDDKRTANGVTFWTK